VKLTGFRQEIFNTPVYYDSESSAGYYRQFLVNTNGTFPGTNGAYADSAARADTFHQVLLPWTFFNWLNLTPRVGGRFTYYSEQDAASGTNARNLPHRFQHRHRRVVQGVATLGGRDEFPFGR
jgi:hypothetical protein